MSAKPVTELELKLLLSFQSMLNDINFSMPATPIKSCTLTFGEGGYTVAVATEDEPEPPTDV